MKTTWTDIITKFLVLLELVGGVKEPASAAFFWWDSIYCPLSHSSVLLIPSLQCNVQDSCSIRKVCVLWNNEYICSEYEMNTERVFVEIPGRVPSLFAAHGWYQFLDASRHNFSGGFLMRDDINHDCGRNGWLYVGRYGNLACSLHEREKSSNWNPVSSFTNVELSVSVMGAPLPTDTPPVKVNFNNEFSIELLLHPSNSTCQAAAAHTYIDHIVSFQADLASYFITASLPCEAVSPSQCVLSPPGSGAASPDRCCGAAIVPVWRYIESVPPLHMLEPPATASNSWSSGDGESASGDGLSEIEKLRLYSSYWRDRKISKGALHRYLSPLPKAVNVDVADRPLASPSPHDMSLPRNRSHICLYFSAKATGMAHKLLHMITSLPPESFQWTFFACHDDGVLEGTIIPDLLAKSNVEVRDCLPGVALSADDINERPSAGQQCVDGASCAATALPSLFEYSAQQYGPDSLTIKVAFEYAILRLREQIPWRLLPTWRKDTDTYASHIAVLRRMISSSISPPWVSTLWNVLLDTISAASTPCEALMVGNDRSPVAGIISEVARLLRIPSVMEMPNLYPHHIVRPDYIIGDSLFVLTHPSVRPLLAPLSLAEPKVMTTYVSQDRTRRLDATMSMLSRPAMGVVISPGVDVSQRQALAAQGSPRRCVCHDSSHCNDMNGHSPPYALSSRAQWRCGSAGPFVMGMVCRLSPEKAVGLFLLAAHALVHTMNCSHCHFVVIGDGPLKADLEKLSHRLNISAEVEFVGWVSNNDIPAHLAFWDVAVTTGAWRETFSMVGIDHMAMGLPLVTFAAGGMGEYIDNPDQTDQSVVTSFLDTNMHAQKYILSRDMMEQEVREVPFMVSRNAVVVREPTPEALAIALLFVQSEDHLRSDIGHHGLLTVQEHFSPEKTVDAFVELFSEILMK